MRATGALARLGMVGALIAGTLAVGAAPSGAAKGVVDASCDAGQYVTVSPAMTTGAPAPTDFAMTGPVSSSAGNCPALPSAQATMSGTLHSTAAHCRGDRMVFAPARGTLTVQWDDSTSSTLRVKFLVTAKNTRLIGHVTAGLYAGDKVSAKLATKVDQFCEDEPLSTFSMSTGGLEHTRPLVFTHA